ncbi:MAG: site-2 protease family protein [Ignavibacteria bacterium]|jgi:membrane-associated protease RseP (regulator of RpoE activity)|nr:site-2 protease family protein [Ignavibacteria bacterium]
MSENYNDPFFSHDQKNVDTVTPSEKTKFIIPVVLFIVTFFTTTLAGAEWIRGFGTRFEFTELIVGLPYSISILFILATHEFGHYFASKYHGVKATLPYFIPFPSLEGFLNFGTMGAVIKTKQAIGNKKALFDIGVSGPIAGFFASLLILIYGFSNLPPQEYILSIHPDYFTAEYGKAGLHLEFGTSLLYYILSQVFTSANDFVPPMNEMYHYPYLCVGWFGLFVTAMNLIPVGQLDGGHITYAMFGEKNQVTVASISMIILFILGAGGIVSSLLELPFEFGWSGWLFWALILYFFIKVKHPPVYDDSEIDFKRKVTGYFSYLIFILSFSPSPFSITF